MDFAVSQELFCSRPVPIRSAQRWSRGVERDAEVREVCRLPMLSRISGPRWLTGQTTAEGADGSSACPGVSTHERGAEAQSLNPGTSSKPTNPSVCGTQAKGCFRGPVPPTTSLVGLNHCPCAVNFSNGMRDARLASERPRKRPFAKRSARSLSGEKEQKDTARPVAELNTGR